MQSKGKGAFGCLERPNLGKPVYVLNCSAQEAKEKEALRQQVVDAYRASKRAPQNPST
jgi:hypothetical protein